HRRQLVGEERLGVVEQPSDQRGLTVIHTARGGEPEHVHAPLRGRPGSWFDRPDSRHQKYPSRLRSSMAASLNRSSPRVAPRSVIRVAATSSITASIVSASDATAAV